MPSDSILLLAELSERSRAHRRLRSSRRLAVAGWAAFVLMFALNAFRPLGGAGAAALTDELQSARARIVELEEDAATWRAMSRAVVSPKNSRAFWSPAELPAGRFDAR